MGMIDYVKLRDALAKGLTDLKNAMSNNVGSLTNPEFGLQALKRDNIINMIPPKNTLVVKLEKEFDSSVFNYQSVFKEERPFIAQVFQIRLSNLMAASWRPNVSTAATIKYGKLKLLVDYGEKNGKMYIDRKYSPPVFLSTNSSQYTASSFAVNMNYKKNTYPHSENYIYSKDEILNNTSSINDTVYVPSDFVNAPDKNCLSSSSGSNVFNPNIFSQNEYMAFPDGVDIKLGFESYSANANGFFTPTGMKFSLFIVGAYVD